MEYKWNDLVGCQASSQCTASPRVGSSAFILSATGSCSGRQCSDGLLRFLDMCTSCMNYLISLLATNKAHASSMFPSLPSPSFPFLLPISSLIPFFFNRLNFLPVQQSEPDQQRQVNTEKKKKALNQQQQQQKQKQNQNKNTPTESRKSVCLLITLTFS